MSDPHNSPGYTPPPSGVVNGVVKTADKVITAIASPVLIFLIVIVGIMVGSMVYIWHTQRMEAITAYAHLVDTCLPGREKQ